MATVLLNKEAVHRAASDKALPLVTKVLDQTLTGARRMVPKRDPRFGDRRAVGRLGASLRQRGPTVRKQSVTGNVGSKLDYAMSVHDGAKAHLIVARRVRFLSFYWERRDVFFVGKRVNHPGIRPGRNTEYLYKPLQVAGRRNGFIVRRLVTGVAAGFADV